MATIEDLTVREALALILSRMSVLPAEVVALSNALGRVLAAPVVAQDDLPPFANSSMDGYAVRAADLTSANSDSPIRLRVVGDIAAGATPLVEVTSGTAARIMTGAPLPHGADTVVPVEDTDEPWRDANRPLPAYVSIGRSAQPGDYVRYPGEDIRAGETVISSGSILRPQEIGVLAALGQERVTVVRRPRVGVLATGDELVEVSASLSPGKIRNSNSYAQAAQVRALGGEPVELGIARDTTADVRAKLETAVSLGVDLLVSSAGVSVGAYDVVKDVLDESGDVAFWRVRMRPGKPLAFGAYRGIPYLGLPGNPVSAMVSFEMFARPSILKMGGHQSLERPRVRVIFLEDAGSDGRESYLRAVVSREDGRYVARATGNQGSHVMTSLTRANALVIVPEGVREVAAGMELDAVMIDWPGSVF